MQATQCGVYVDCREGEGDSAQGYSTVYPRVTPLLVVVLHPFNRSMPLIAFTEERSAGCRGVPGLHPPVCVWPRAGGRGRAARPTNGNAPRAQRAWAAGSGLAAARGGRRARACCDTDKPPSAGGDGGAPRRSVSADFF